MKTIAPWRNILHIEVYDFTNGITNPEASESDGPVEIFTVAGVACGSSLEGLAPGIYIERQGNRTRKIAVK